MKHLNRLYHWFASGPLDVFVAITMLVIALGIYVRPDAPFTAYVIDVSHISMTLWVDILLTSAFLLFAEHVTKGVTVSHFVILEAPLVFLGALFIGFWLVTPSASIIPVAFAIGFLGAINKLNGLRMRLSALGIKL